MEITAGPGAFPGVTPEERPRTAPRTRQILLALLAAVLIASGGGLTGVGQYASARRALAAAAEVRAGRFEGVFREASEARLQALRLGAEIIVRDEPVAQALRDRDRAELTRRAVPLIEQVLRPRFGITLLNFVGKDGTVFLRAHRPEQFGDVAVERAMVAAALKNRSTTSGIDIGRSGPELRAVTPVMAGETLAGLLELGSAPWDTLQAAAQATGLDFAFAMDRRAAQALDLPRRATDLVKDEALYIRYSRPEVRDLIAAASFAPTETKAQMLAAGDRDLFVQTVPILDASRQPVTRVTVVEDLTDDLAARRLSIALTTALATVGLLTVVLLGLFQFQTLRARIERNVTGRLQELRGKAQAYDRMSGALRDVQAWKLSVLAEVVLLIRDPLTAVQGSLEGAARSGGDAGALAFAAGEVRRLNAAVDAQAAMMAMRDRLHRVEVGPVDLTALVAELIRDCGGPSALSAALDPDLPLAAGNAALLRAALTAVVAVLQRRTSAAPLRIEVRAEGGGAVGRVGGAGAWRGSAPDLDGAAVFGTPAGPDHDGSLMLARLTIEHFGGSLTRIDDAPGRVGFAFSLRGA